MHYLEKKTFRIINREKFYFTHSSKCAYYKIFLNSNYFKPFTLNEVNSQNTISLSFETFSIYFSSYDRVTRV